MKQSFLLILLSISIHVYSSQIFSNKIIINRDTFYTSDFPLHDLLQEKNLCLFLTPVDFVWKIENSKIYLLNDTSITFAERTEQIEIKTYKLSDIISNKPIDKWFLADFVSDTLRINYGKSTAFPRMGDFESRYIDYFEKEKEIIFKNGNVTIINDFENFDIKENHLSVFNESTLDSIVKLLNENINWNALPNEKKEWIQEIFVVTITPDGNSFISLYDEEAIMNGDYYIDYNEEKKYKDEVGKVLNILKWNIVKKHGQPITASIIFDIEFNFEKKLVTNPYKKNDY